MTVRTIKPRIGGVAHRVRVIRGDAPNTVATPRLRGRRWMAICAHMMRKQPWCMACLARGVYTPGRQTDHIVPLSLGGTDDESNLQRLCNPCHDEKSEREEKSRLAAKGHTWGG